MTTNIDYAQELELELEEKNEQIEALTEKLEHLGLMLAISAASNVILLVIIWIMARG